MCDVASTAARRPPLRPDPDSLARRMAKTHYVYRRAFGQFMSWITVHGLVIHNDWELDDLLVEYKNQAALAKSAFAQQVCSSEMAIPMAKGQLTLAHAVLADMAHARRRFITCRCPSRLRSSSPPSWQPQGMNAWAPDSLSSSNAA